MKVCILQTVLDPYKGANHLPLYAALPGIEYTIVCNRSNVNEDDIPSNVSVITVPGRIGSYYYGVSDALFARVLLRTYPADHAFWKSFDVIHINQIMGPALRRLKNTGVPLLFLIHHPVTADLQVVREESGWFRGILWWLKYALLIRWQRTMCRVATAVATVSETMKKRICADYGIQESIVSVVFNGVDGDDFPLVTDIDCRTDVVAVGSFIHPRKGFKYLLSVYRGLAKQGVTIADVGRRSDEQRAQLHAIPGVTVYGMVSAQELRDLIAHSRILVSTSLFEGFGLSLIEALSCGHPSFAFAVGAVPEVLGSVDASLVIEPRNTAAMVQAIEEYLRLPTSKRDENSRRFRDAALQKFSLTSSANQLLEVYEQLISRH